MSRDGAVLLDTPLHARANLLKFHVTDDDVMDVLGLKDYAQLKGIAAEIQLKALTDAGLRPYEAIETNHNLFMYAGVAWLWQAFIGTTLSGGSGSTLLVPYSNANAYIGVGDSTTAAAATQTDLQASTNKLRKAMDSTYPQNTDSTSSGGANCVVRSTFATSDANYAWQEWGIFNASAAGRMFDRKVESLGTKTSAAAWQFTVTLTIA